MQYIKLYKVTNLPEGCGRERTVQKYIQKI